MLRTTFKLIVSVFVAAVVSLGLLQGLEVSGFPAMSTSEELLDDLMQSFKSDKKCEKDCRRPQ